MNTLSFKILFLATLAVGVLGVSGCNDSTSNVVSALPAEEDGGWSTGDLHVHTIQSNDAQITTSNVLDLGINKYKLDWIFLSNHLRMESRDNEGNQLVNGEIPFSEGIKLYEVPFVKYFLSKLPNQQKTIFSSVEWDMPTHDHANIGIGYNNPNSDANLKAIAEFEYLFTNKKASYFSTDITQKYKESDRAFTTHDDAVKALGWLKANYPDSYMVLNHPSRGVNKYTAAQIREFNDTAPDIFFLLEGMIGNQMEPNRGGYESAYTNENLEHRSYGGSDYYVAKVGGLWDSLLGEGRQIWNVADSDYHFGQFNGTYSSGYAPGEYAKTYLWKNGYTIPAIVNALRQGRSFGVYGDLINALDFTAISGKKKSYMGQTLVASKGSKVTITIKFKSPNFNNEEYPFNSASSANSKPIVDHVDLIVGDVGGKYIKGTAEYNSSTNPSTKVLARFTSKDWTTDLQGYNVISYDLTLEKNQYIRLRGTNLGLNVDGETVNGEPLPDQKITTTDNQTRFNEINKRNYKDLWFYSNPIFLTTSL